MSRYRQKYLRDVIPAHQWPTYDTSIPEAYYDPDEWSDSDFYGVLEGVDCPTAVKILRQLSPWDGGPTAEEIRDERDYYEGKCGSLVDQTPIRMTPAPVPTPTPNPAPNPTPTPKPKPDPKKPFELPSWALPVGVLLVAVVALKGK